MNVKNVKLIFIIVNTPNQKFSTRSSPVYQTSKKRQELIQVKSRPSQCTQLIHKIMAPLRRALDEYEDKLRTFAAKLERIRECVVCTASVIACESFL